MNLAKEYLEEILGIEESEDEADEDEDGEDEDGEDEE